MPTGENRSFDTQSIAGGVYGEINFIISYNGQEGIIRAVIKAYPPLTSTTPSGHFLFVPRLLTTLHISHGEVLARFPYGSLSHMQIVSVSGREDEEQGIPNDGSKSS
jgi:hypothetical protein